MKFTVTAGEATLHNSSVGHVTCVYGSPKAGKSSFALTATKQHKCIFIDTENSGGKVWDRIPPDQKNVDNRFVVNVGDLDDLSLFISTFDLRDYGLVIIDSLTHLVEKQIQNERDRRGKNISIDYWGHIADTFKRFISKCQQRGVSVIIVVHEEETASEKGFISRPKTQGNMIGEILRRDCDNIVYITSRDGKRIMYTRPSDTFIAGCRDNVPEVLIGENINYEKFSEGFARYEPKFISKSSITELKKKMRYWGITPEKEEAFFKRFNTQPEMITEFTLKEMERVFADLQKKADYEKAQSQQIQNQNASN